MFSQKNNLGFDEFYRCAVLTFEQKIDLSLEIKMVT